MVAGPRSISSVLSSFVATNVRYGIFEQTEEFNPSSPLLFFYLLDNIVPTYR